MRNYISGPLTKLWSKDEAHGNFWVFQHLYLSSSEPFQVRNLKGKKLNFRGGNVSHISTIYHCTKIVNHMQTPHWTASH